MTSTPAMLESALTRLESVADPAARDAARAVVSAVLELHGAGLQSLSRKVREFCPDGDRILEHLVEDELIASLFSLHGLHPLPLEARVRRAIASVRQFAEGEPVDIVSIEETVVRLRVGRGERFRNALARALDEALPEIERIELLSADPSVIAPGRLVRKRATSHERCELCGEGLPTEHPHLFDVERRRLLCGCSGCSVLFEPSAGKVRRVHRHVQRLEPFRITDAQWQALEVPVALAFFSYASSVGQVLAAYPGPAGAIESAVSRSAWDRVVEGNAVLADLEADTSALLVDRLSAEPSYYLLSIDECYRLTGLIRSHWQGLTGGDAAERALGEFFGGPTEVRS